LAESGYEQNCFSAHRTPAMPPHILPVGAAADAEGAGVAADADVAGAEEETTGGAGLAASVAGARAPAAGAGCAEQLTSAVNDRNAPHTSTGLDLLMRQH